MPMQDFIRPLSPPPASVTPRCRGNTVPSSLIILTSSLYACVITTVLLAFRETTTEWKFRSTHILTHSMAAVAMANGVLPYFSVM